LESIKTLLKTRKSDYYFSAEEEKYYSDKGIFIMYCSSGHICFEGAITGEVPIGNGLLSLKKPPKSKEISCAKISPFNVKLNNRKFETAIPHEEFKNGLIMNIKDLPERK
jgi:hypothetical protein